MLHMAWHGICEYFGYGFSMYRLSSIRPSDMCISCLSRRTQGWVLYKAEILEHCTAYDEDSFLFPTNPLDDLVRALCECRSRRSRWCNSIQFEQWCTPRKRYTCSIRLMMNFERRRLIM